jgi:hypothetical protein
MVRGLEIFRERLRRFEGSFILIGGAACDQWSADNRLEFPRNSAPCCLSPF